MTPHPAAAPLSDADYCDAYRAHTPMAAAHQPQEWARLVLEGASRPMRIFLRVGWTLLGFRLTGERSVLGWPIIDESPDCVVLTQRSWLFEVVLLMRASDDELNWSTRVKYSSALGAAVWAVVGIIHRRFAPRALQRAVATAT